MAKNAQHWEKTKGLLIVTLVIWAIFSMGIFLFGAELNSGYWTFWVSINLLVHMSRFSWNICNPYFLVCRSTRKN
jgi:hypothetical protein